MPVEDVRLCPRRLRCSAHNVDVAILFQVVCLAALGIGVFVVQMSAYGCVLDRDQVLEASLTEDQI